MLIDEPQRKGSICQYRDRLLEQAHSFNMNSIQKRANLRNQSCTWNKNII
jgi:hypothetical protein